MEDSADDEVRWVKKGKDAFFGYRGYSAVDTEDGYVEHVEVHPANQAEVNKLPGIVDALVEQGSSPKACWPTRAMRARPTASTSRAKAWST